jgi:hypothetical protein
MKISSICLLALLLSSCSGDTSESSLPNNDSAVDTGSASGVPVAVPVAGNETTNSRPEDESGSTDPASTEPGSNTDSVSQDAPGGNIINSDNVNALLLQAFEVYSGKAYDNRLYQFPYLLEDNQQCENDGTTTQSDTELTFTNCLIAGDTVTGNLLQAQGNGAINRNFENFIVTFAPDGRMEVSGSQDISCCDPADQFTTTNFDYGFSYSAGTLDIFSSNTTKHIEPGRGQMSGSFSMDPPAASGERFDVATPVDFTFDYGGNLSDTELEELSTEWLFQSGVLQIHARDGSEVKLDADTGDDSTVSITLSNADGTATTTESWNRWTEAVRWSPSAQNISFTRENSIAILDEIFAVYSGHALKEPLFALPGYSSLPEHSELIPTSEAGHPQTDENGYGDTAQENCSGGGDARFTAIWEPKGRFDRFGWLYSFNQCVDGDNTLQGSLELDNNSSFYTYKTNGFAKSMPDGNIEMSGLVSFNPLNWYGCEQCQQWESTSLELTAETAATNISISSGNTYYLKGMTFPAEYAIPDIRFSGSTSVRSPTTSNHWIHAKVLEEFRYYSADNDLDIFSEGKLELRADNGDTLTLNADNGDPLTAEIVLTNSGEATSFTQNVSTWLDSLRPVLDHPPEMD